MQDIARLAHAIFVPYRLVDCVVEIILVDTVLWAPGFGNTAARLHDPDCPRRLHLRGLEQE